MTLSQAIEAFAASPASRDRFGAAAPASSEAIPRLDLFTSYFSRLEPLSEVTVGRLREFLSRWVVEHCDARTEPLDLFFQSLDEFFEFAQSQGWADFAQQISVLRELRPQILRAVEIGHGLAEYIRVRSGAFGFPEFLTSFEEGGRSQYDVDELGAPGTIEGLFRIIRVEGALAEAEEIISAEHVWPINFPSEVSALLDQGYVVNLSLSRVGERWEIFESGFTYPPGVDV